MDFMNNPGQFISSLRDFFIWPARYFEVIDVGTKSKRYSNSVLIRVLIFVLILLINCNSSFGSDNVFTDSLGRTVRLGHLPQRIVSLAPSITEMLFFLGLGDRVIGVTRFSDYPPGALSKPKIGSYDHLNVEKIVALNPDLAIGTRDGNKPGVIGLLDQAGIPVYIVNPKKINDVALTVKALGEVCGVPKKGMELCRNLLAEVGGVFDRTKNLPRPMVFLQINLKPIMSVNKDTIHDDVIHLAGGVNMTHNAPMKYPRVSIEQVIKMRPDIIIISSMERGGRFEKARKEWYKWQGIPAVKKGRVYLIDSDLMDRPAPRIIKGLKAMARLIHPEVPWEKEEK